MKKSATSAGRIASYDRFSRAQGKRYSLAVWQDSACLNWHMENPEGGHEPYALESRGVMNVDDGCLKSVDTF